MTKRRYLLLGSATKYPIKKLVNELSNEFSVVSELKPFMKNLNLKFKVVEIEESKEVPSKYDKNMHKVADAIIGDETGIVRMTLWDDDIQKLESGKTYQLTNGKTSLFKRHMRVSRGKEGVIEEITEEINVNSENDMSSREYKPRTKGKFRNKRRGARWGRESFRRKSRRSPRA